QVVGKLDVCLVDLIDEQHGALVHRKRFPKLALADVVLDVTDPRVTQLAIAQAAHRIVFVEALHGLGGRFDVPLDERGVHWFGDFLSQHSLAGAGLSFDKQRPLQGNSGIDRDLKIIGRDVVFGALELHDLAPLLPGPAKRRATLRGRRGRFKRRGGQKGAPRPATPLCQYQLAGPLVAAPSKWRPGRTLGGKRGGGCAPTWGRAPVGPWATSMGCFRLGLLAEGRWSLAVFSFLCQAVQGCGAVRPQGALVLAKYSSSLTSECGANMQVPDRFSRVG